MASSSDWITLFSLFELCATSSSAHSQQKPPEHQVEYIDGTPDQPEMGVVMEAGEPGSDEQVNKAIIAGLYNENLTSTDSVVMQ